MLIQRRIAQYCMLVGADMVDENVHKAHNLMCMAKYCLDDDFERAHKFNLCIKSKHVDKWMGEWYLETIKKQLT